MSFKDVQSILRQPNPPLGKRNGTSLLVGFLNKIDLKERVTKALSEERKKLLEEART